jgi:Na+/H+-dicarboxylate symporter
LASLAVPVSLAAVGLPAQISFFATIAPLCLAFGIPVTALPLLLAIEVIPDLFRTLGNVTSDLAVSCVVSSGGRALQGFKKPSLSIFLTASLA